MPESIQSCFPFTCFVVVRLGSAIRLFYPPPFECSSLISAVEKARDATPKERLQNIPVMAPSHLCCNCVFTNSDLSHGLLCVSCSCWIRVCSGGCPQSTAHPPLPGPLAFQSSVIFRAHNFSRKLHLTTTFMNCLWILL